jgi:gliding motility-associated-like protein
VFTNTSTGASGYVIDYGDGSLPDVTTTHVYGANGSYTVMIVAFNGSMACTDTAYVTINVFDNVVFSVPNVFTPNGDGDNDEFMIMSVGLKTVTGTMFNRWGKQIATFGDEPTDGWDGKIQGKKADDGTYYYIISATGFDGKEYTEKGYVQLLGGK